MRDGGSSSQAVLGLAHRVACIIVAGAEDARRPVYCDDDYVYLSVGTRVRGCES